MPYSESCLFRCIHAYSIMTIITLVIITLTFFFFFQFRLTYFSKKFKKHMFFNYNHVNFNAWLRLQFFENFLRSPLKTFRIVSMYQRKIIELSWTYLISQFPKTVVITLSKDMNRQRHQLTTIHEFVCFVVTSCVDISLSD